MLCYTLSGREIEGINSCEVFSMHDTIFSPVPFHCITMSDGFWKDRITTNRTVTALANIDQCEKTHRIDNFRRSAGRQQGGFEGIYYNDSDVYKVLEGVAYMLMGGVDPELERVADGIIDDICAAQQPDGYLYNYFILAEPGHRWTDMNYHEAYSLGHMVEAAVAYDQATGKDKWLRTAIRAVRQMMDEIGPGKKHWVTGHEELELALVKLYRHTGDESYLEYAQWLVDERGHGHLRTPLNPDTILKPVYCQDDVPARQLQKVTGHAVRAMYYYSALADLAALKKDDALKKTLFRLWHNVVPANFYITGGIGQSAHNEGFTHDWSLPNQTAYCETCAAIGMALWNHRMNLLTGDAKYADIVEREMYNGILSGVSLKGDTFFYVNPLSSVGNHHRQKWYHTSCCPTNIVRFLPSVGGYAYATDESRVIVNQYLPGKATIGETQLSVQTAYPWDGHIALIAECAPEGALLSLRIPGWCDRYTLLNNNEPFAAQIENGYVTLPVKTGDRIELNLDMPVRRVRADERVLEDRGRIAVMRGPIVYCAEACDNPGFVDEYFPAELSLTDDEAGLFTPDGLPADTIGIRIGDVKLVPYALWDNRAPGAMAVWLKQ